MSTCKTCGGVVIVVLARAWCTKSYAENGCTGYWQRRTGRWVLDQDPLRLEWVAFMKSPEAIAANAAFNVRHLR